METLVESSTEPATRVGKRWRVVVARPGLGTSGDYSADVLREYGHVALPPKTKAFWGHANAQDRDPRDQIGTYPDGAYWDETENALVAELLPYKRWYPVIEEMDSDLEVSINVAGGRDASGKVLNLAYARGNTVDVVGYAGLEGSSIQGQVENLIESARSQFGVGSGAEASAQEKEEKTIMDEKLIEALASVATVLGEVKTFLVEAKTEAQAKVDADALKTATSDGIAEALVAYQEKEKLIEAADLPVSFVESIRAEALLGTDVVPLIESAKKVVAEVKTSLVENGKGDGAALIESAKTAHNYVVAGWVK